MAVVENGKLYSLSDYGMSEFEKNVTSYEKIVKKIMSADKKLAKAEKEMKKRGGIYKNIGKDFDDEDVAEEEEEKEKNRIALPSRYIRKERKQKEAGMYGGREIESKQKLTDEKIRVTEEKDKKLNVVSTIMKIILNKDPFPKKTARASLISGEGRPVRKADSWKKLTNKVTNLEKSNSALARAITHGKTLVGGGSNVAASVPSTVSHITNVTNVTNVSNMVTDVATVPGLAGVRTGLLTKVPFAATIIYVATKVFEKYTEQYGVGGTRDVRKKFKAESASLIGVEEENKILGGNRVFLSNPNYSQGLPVSKSNTSDMMAGQRRYNQRKQGR